MHMILQTRAEGTSLATRSKIVFRAPLLASQWDNNNDNNEMQHKINGRLFQKQHYAHDVTSVLAMCSTSTSTTSRASLKKIFFYENIEF